MIKPTYLFLSGCGIDRVHTLTQRELHVLMLRWSGPRRWLLRWHQRALCRSRRLLRACAARRHRALSLQTLCRLKALLSCLQALCLQVLQRLMGQIQLMLLHDALLHNALLHFDVLVHGELMNRVKGCGRCGVRRGEPLTLHLCTLKRFVQPLHRKGALAEVIHGCVGACRPSRATPASTDSFGDRRRNRARRDCLPISTWRQRRWSTRVFMYYTKFIAYEIKFTNLYTSKGDCFLIIMHLGTLFSFVLVDALRIYRSWKEKVILVVY